MESSHKAELQVSPADAAPSEPAADAVFCFPLPSDVVASIFLLLPVPDRLRCREVSPAWRAFLAQPRLWRVLDLSPKAAASWTHPVRSFVKLLRAASRAARGGAEVLDLSGAPLSWLDPSDHAGKVLAENAQALRIARIAGCDKPVGAFWAQSIIAHSPNLTELTVDVNIVGDNPELSSYRCSSTADVLSGWLRLLAGPRGAAVRVETLTISLAIEGMYGEDVFGDEPGRGWESIPAALRALGRLLGRAEARRVDTLILEHFDLGDAELAAAAADAAIASRPRVLSFSEAILAPPFLPLVTRVVVESPELEGLLVSRRQLSFFNSFEGPPLLKDAADANVAAFCAALRASRLTALMLGNVGLWDPPVAAGAAVAEALLAHPTLRTLDLSGNPLRTAEARGAAAEAFMTIVAVDSPALRSLNFSIEQWTGRMRGGDMSGSLGLGVKGLVGVLLALHYNSHLESLWFGGGGYDYKREVLRAHGLAAARACASLRELGRRPPLAGNSLLAPCLGGLLEKMQKEQAAGEWGEVPEIAEVHKLLEARRRPGNQQEADGDEGGEGQDSSVPAAAGAPAGAPAAGGGGS